MSVLTQINTDTNWGEFSAGNDFVIATKTNGTLWSWPVDPIGNSVGQLALNNTTAMSSQSPNQVGSLTNWLHVAAGYSHAAAIKTDGTLWMWGNNSLGQLGQGNLTNYSSPVQVGSATNWSYISCGRSSTTGVMTDGTIWMWGQDAYGSVVVSPAQIGANVASVASGYTVEQLTLDSNSSAWVSGTQVGSSYVKISSAAKFAPVLSSSTSITSDSINYNAIDSGGFLWSWGINTTGQLGLGNTLTYSLPTQVGSTVKNAAQWSTVSCGYSNIASIKNNGTLWTWGSNFFGQLGQNNTSAYVSAVQVGALTNWKTISVGNGWWLGTQTDNSLWACGYNGAGQLGTGDIINYSSPVHIGAGTTWAQAVAGKSASMAIKSDGTLWRIGSPLAQVGSATNWTHVSANTYTDHFTGIAGGSLWAWTSAASLIQVSSATNWTYVSDGIAVKSDGTLWTIVSNSPVQFGASTNWATAAQSNSGNSYVVATQTNGTLWAWPQTAATGGNDNYSQLGYSVASGTIVPINSPVQIGASTNWASVSAGSGYNNAALDSSGHLFVWGADGYADAYSSNSVGNSSTPMQVGHTSPSEVASFWAVVPLTTTNTVTTTTSVASTTTATVGSPSRNVKITNSIFDNIAAEGIVTTGAGTGVHNVISAFNTFKNVGNMLGNTSVTHVVNFGGDNSYSIADIFDRSYNDAIAPVNLNNTASIAILPNGQLMVGRQMSVGGQAATLLDNSANADAGIIGFGNYPAIVEYTISRANDKRTGMLKIVPSNGTIVYDTDYIETNDIGVELTPILNNGLIQLNYTTTATGNAAAITTASRSLF